MPVVVFGSLNMDLIVRCSRLPLPGETLLGESFLIAPGGKGANQAVACARLGSETYMVGRVGDDSFGAAMLQSLRNDGVLTAGVTVDNTQQSGVALITVESSGENTIIVASGANGSVSAGDLARIEGILDRASVLLLQLEIPLEAVIAAARAARQRGVTVILDPAPARDLPAELYGLVDIITPNENETARLVGFTLESNGDIERAARMLRTRGAGSVVIKLGSRGAYLLDQESGVFLQGVQIEAVDTVAAGDAFNGGLATALDEDQDIRMALRRATAAGALAVAKAGAQPSLPERQAVLDLMTGSPHC